LPDDFVAAAFPPAFSPGTILEANLLREGGTGSLRHLEKIEQAAIMAALEQHDGNRTRAAATLNISVRTLQRKLKIWGLVGDAPAEAAIDLESAPDSAEIVLDASPASTAPTPASPSERATD